MSDYRDIHAGPTPEERAAAWSEFEHARRVVEMARANVVDAENGLTLARLALERAREMCADAERRAAL